MLPPLHNFQELRAYDLDDNILKLTDCIDYALSRQSTVIGRHNRTSDANLSVNYMNEAS